MAKPSRLRFELVPNDANNIQKATAPIMAQPNKAMVVTMPVAGPKATKSPNNTASIKQ